MKIYALTTLFLTLIMIFSPLIFANFSTNDTTDENKPTENLSEVSQDEKETTTQAENVTVKVLRTSSEKVVDVDLLEYLVGCVSCEMPATYELEALKSQAVVSYTYLKWFEKNGDKSKLSDANISDSTQSHQGYLNENERKEKWGDKFEQYNKKVTQAVNEVYGKYITYKNEVIMSCFHAISSGSTNSAQDVWGEDLPYLQTKVASGDKLSPDFEKTTKLSPQEVKTIFSSQEGTALEKVQPEDFFQNAITSDNGLVQKIDVGNKTFTGAQIRQLLELTSANFTINFDGTNFIIVCKGYGHGVGLSQYSANFMARQGSDYLEILLHFFDGVEVSG